jgi:hypothetical protein
VFGYKVLIHKKKNIIGFLFMAISSWGQIVCDVGELLYSTVGWLVGIWVMGAGFLDGISLKNSIS